MELQRLSIRSTNAKLGMESPRGQLEIQSSSGQLEISSPRVDQQIRQPNGDLQIDSSAAYLAYSMGGIFETSDMLADQAKQRIYDNIGKIAQDGNRMAQIANKSNAIAELASTAMTDGDHLRPYGAAGLFNVKVSYTAHPAEVTNTPQRPNIEFHVQKPEINYTPGKVNIYIEQMNSIKMWVSNYDYLA